MYVFQTTFLMGLALMLSACQPISGKLDVATKLAAQLIEHHGPVTAGCLMRDGGCGEPVIHRVSANFHPGTYEARLTLGTGEALQLTVNDGTARHAVMKVQIPQSVELPRVSGRFKIRASESGQPFDVDGDMETIESSSPVKAGWEGCQRQIKRRFCEHAKTSGISKQRGVRCRHAYQTVYGHRAVEFHVLTRTLSVRLEFKNDPFADNIAEFNGASERKYKVYDYRGPCEFDNLFVRQGV